MSVFSGHLARVLVLFLTLPQWGSVQAAEPIASHSFLSNFQNLELVDHRGTPFRPQALLGQVVLFNFVFTGCDSTCPLQTQPLARVLNELPPATRRQVRFVSVSIDPGNDSPAKLRAFARQLGADLPGWDFVTGDVNDLLGLARQLQMLNADQPDAPQIHRTSLWLVDKQGRMLQRYRGNPPDRERLVRELVQVSALAPIAAHRAVAKGIAP